MAISVHAPSGGLSGQPWVTLLRRQVVKRVLLAAAAGTIVWFLVVPQLSKSGEALHSLGRTDVWWPLLAVVLEAGALIAYAQLTRSVLPSRASAPKLGTVLRVDLSTLALSHVVPAGSAAGITLRYRLFTRLGISGTDAAFGAATQSLGSAVVLNGMLWIAIVVAIPLHGANPLYASAAITGGVLIALLAGLAYALTRGESATARRLGSCFGRLPLLSAPQVESLVHAFASRLRQLSADRRRLVRAMGWAALNWTLDMAALWVLLAGLGHRVGLVGILVCFGLANVAAALPITPGGLGVVEAALSTLLVGFSVPAETALFGVLCWRAVNFWLPIPVGGLAYVSLQRSLRRKASYEAAPASPDSLPASPQPKRMPATSATSASAPAASAATATAMRAIWTGAPRRTPVRRTPQRRQAGRCRSMTGSGSRSPHRVDGWVELQVASGAAGDGPAAFVDHMVVEVAEQREVVGVRRPAG